MQRSTTPLLAPTPRLNGPRSASSPADPMAERSAAAHADASDRDGIAARERNDMQRPERIDDRIEGPTTMLSELKYLTPVIASGAVAVTIALAPVAAADDQHGPPNPQTCVSSVPRRSASSKATPRSTAQYLPHTRGLLHLRSVLGGLETGSPDKPSRVRCTRCAHRDRRRDTVTTSLVSWLSGHGRFAARRLGPS
jgi:hypothetical protein